MLMPGAGNAIGQWQKPDPSKRSGQQMHKPSHISDLGSIALYGHIPFCETKCPYCDFNTYAGIEALMPAYVKALCREITVWGDALGRPLVHSVSFGGGTPSYLPAEDMGLLMETVDHAFDIDSGAEVTLEANPGDLSGARLAAYQASGVNRLSIGLQSLDDRLLGVLGRRHSAAEARQAFHMARDAGFDNVSVDLMYGLPYQSIDDWSRTLDGIAEMSPPHVSMYCLTLEARTPMDQGVRAGRMPEPDDDLAADMYLLAQDTMEANGYRHYEISNWAIPGKESKHNLTYWQNQPYLGVGPGAHSYLMGHRFHNLRSPREYIQRLSPSLALHPAKVEGQDGVGADAIRSVPVVESTELIDRRLEMAETMMMGLRLDTGVAIASFAQRFGVELKDTYGEELDELEAHGLLEAANGAIRLTARGRLLGSEVFSRFFA